MPKTNMSNASKDKLKTYDNSMKNLLMMRLKTNSSIDTDLSD
jgi:hypothetical protein